MEKMDFLEKLGIAVIIILVGVVALIVLTPR